ncbi:DUF6292 family protein [Actinocrispum sp. NPDC049592]|uniref:DUF6292 family protein n=1 Tax=Actinocrispum sp. NPDC049592 TaxID=3154835 RepID=UPI003421D3AF
MIDDVRDYLADVSRQAGVGLESCCWGWDSPAWGYIALDWRLNGRDVALVWDETTGWAIATETDGAELDIVAHLDGEITPPASTVAQFAATLRSEVPWAPLTAAG